MARARVVSNDTLSLVADSVQSIRLNGGELQHSFTIWQDQGCCERSCTMMTSFRILIAMFKHTPCQLGFFAALLAFLQDLFQRLDVLVDFFGTH